VREWVKPFLIQKIQDAMAKELGHKVGEGWRERYAMQLVRDKAVYYGLANCFNTHFGSGGLNGLKEGMIYTFGSVLADLPEEVFRKLYEAKNLFFSFTPNPGAETKVFFPEHDIKTGEKIQVVTFPYISDRMPLLALRGQIVHELIYLYHGNEFSMSEVTEKTDEIARTWGFEEEIRAFRDYWAETEAQERAQGF
jgi:hypothetical protein